MSFQPTSPGARRDLAQETDLADELGFFGSHEEARRFVALGLPRLPREWPHALTYADFGGGPGVLTGVVRDHLRAAGHRVHAIVADGNPRYLERAQQAELAVELCNLDQCTLRGLQLVTMRLVNHYNDATMQERILAAARRALAPGGLFVSQIETGSIGGCRARTAIANLESLTDGDEAGYCWPTEAEYLAMLARAGFGESTVVGTVEESTAVPVALEMAWRRFQAGSVRRARLHDDRGALHSSAERRARFYAQAQHIIDATVAEFGDDAHGLYEGGRRLHASLAIVVSRV